MPEQHEKEFIPHLNKFRKGKLRDLLATFNGRRRFCLTLAANEFSQGQDITDADEHHNGFAEFILDHGLDISACSKNKSGDEHHRFKEAARSACEGRRLFFEADDQFGLAPAAARPEIRSASCLGPVFRSF